MNTNAIADEILAYLKTKHSRAYRNKSPKKPTYPYVVFRIDSGVPSYPSENRYINIDIYDSASKTSRAVENLADLIDGDGKREGAEPTGFNRRIIDTDDFNAFFELEQRQYVQSEELAGVQLINMRYVMQVFSK